MVETNLNKKPLISIIINCRNGEKYLKKSVSSVLNQTYNNWEIIFFDNNSAGLQFAAVGRVIYESAKKQKLGMHIPMEWFHQDIRN